MMRILTTLLPHLLATANTILLLALFFGINQRVRSLRKRFAANEASARTDVGRTSASISDLSNRLTNLEKEFGGLRTAEGRACAVNGALRAKILKMYRLGQGSDRIAETLKLPAGEVDLLVKVHKIVMQAYERTGVSESGVAPVEKG